VSEEGPVDGLIQAVARALRPDSRAGQQRRHTRDGCSAHEDRGWKAVIDLNLTGVFSLATRACEPQHVKARRAASSNINLGGRLTGNAGQTKLQRRQGCVVRFHPQHGRRFASRRHHR